MSQDLVQKSCKTVTMQWIGEKMYVCWNQLRAFRQRCVYAKSSNQDIAPKRKTAPYENPHAFAALDKTGDEGEPLSRDRPGPVQWLAD